jgi:anaerobic selenocysteine-containing dehydrogenase
MKKENKEWKQISWDEALDTIAARLTKVKERYGARALVGLFGQVVLTGGGETAGIIKRFYDVYGTPNVFSVDTMCFRTKLAGHQLTGGKFFEADTENARCILVWGRNPHESCVQVGRQIADLKDKGTKLIVIDPRATLLAKKADMHAQPRPGSDCALALGMMNVIISEELYDKEFVDSWTVGFDKLADHVQRYPPHEVEKLTWVPAETIKAIARMYAITRPACIMQGTNALEQHAAGAQNCRAIVILQALTGNIDVPGGYVRIPRVDQNELRLPKMLKEKPLGADKFPISYEVPGFVFGEGQAMVLPDAILTGEPYPIKAMVISGSNPVLTWPNSKKIREAITSLDFLVVMDLFMTETAKLADIVLPAATFFEQSQFPLEFAIVNGYQRYTMLRKKAVEIEGCRSDCNFWLQLAKRMGYGEYFPWKDQEEVIDYLLQPSGLTVKQLKEDKPSGFLFGSPHYKEYQENGFGTPSKKVELYSETMAELGYKPLPTHVEPPESPISSPELAKEYPLVLTTGARLLRYWHTQYRNLEQLHKAYPEALAEINPQTAKKYDINDGDIAILATRRGSIEIRAKVTEDIVAGVVNVAHGWSQANVNLLTDEKPADPISGFPALKSLLCKISRKT